MTTETDAMYDAGYRHVDDDQPTCASCGVEQDQHFGVVNVGCQAGEFVAYPGETANVTDAPSTETTDKPLTHVEGTAVVQVNVSDLYRVLFNASLFVSKDQTRPVLTSVHLRVTDSADATPNTITATATDSYTMGEDSCATAVGSDVNGKITRTYILRADDLSPVVKALKASRTTFPKVCTMTLGGSDGMTRDAQTSAATVSFKIDGTSFELPTFIGDYPNTEPLFDAATLDDAHQLPDGTISLNPKRLDVFGKVLRMSGKPSTRDNHDAMILHFNGDNKAVLVTLRDHGSTFRALVMPDRSN